MEVFCIKQESEIEIAPESGKFTAVHTPLLQVGSIYEVIEAYSCGADVYYSLSGFPFYDFHSKLFAPLSEIDEMELVNHKLQTV